MRILLLSHGLPPDSVGGVEQHVDGLARALAAAGHEVEIFARADLPELPQGALGPTRGGNPTVTRAAYRWQQVGSLAALYESPPMADTLRGFVEQRRAAGVTFDVAHVHHLTGMSLAALDVLAAARVPTVLTLHDYWLICPRGQMFHHRAERCDTATVARCGECLQATFPWWLAPGTRDHEVEAVHARALQALARPQALVVPSARVIAPFAALGVPPGRFTVVENGVDVDQLAAVPPPAAGPGPLRLGYLGTIMPSKGLHVLLEALALLPPATATLQVHGNVVPYHGDDGYATRCFGMLRPGAGVHYSGPYGLGELPRVLAGIDVLAAPALWHEAFGLTVREALAAGRPVLVSRVGGLPEAIVDGAQGLVLPPGDAAAWAAAIARLAGDRRLLHRLAAGTRPRARGFAAMAAELLAVYDRARAAAGAATT